MRRGLLLLFWAVLVTVVLRTYFFETISVASGSMEPTLFVDTHYLVNRWAYRGADPKRGDIISFASPLDHKTRFVKRVIAVPGDEVELKAKKVWLNGKPLEEPYAVYKRAEERLAGDTLGPLTVPRDGYFVLGDNRDESFDSSVWKDAAGEPVYFVDRKDVRGRIVQFQ